MDMDAAQAKRNAQLRWSMLRMLYSARALESGINGATLIEQLNAALPPSRQIEDETQGLMLITDLVRGSYATTRDNRTHRHQRYSAEWLDVRITDRGSRFVEGHEPADGAIDDGRIVKGASQ